MIGRNQARLWPRASPGDLVAIQEPETAGTWPIASPGEVSGGGGPVAAVARGEGIGEGEPQIGPNQARTRREMVAGVTR